MQKILRAIVASMLAVSAAIWSSTGNAAPTATEDGVLLDPDAVLAGVFRFEQTEHKPPIFGAYKDSQCNIEINLENYKIDKWIKCQTSRNQPMQFKIKGEFYANGDIKNLTVSSNWFMYPMSGSVERSEGTSGGDTQKNPWWRAILTLSNSDYERRKSKFAQAAPHSNQASPQLPPATYKPIPVGTVIEYDTWKCEVVRNDGFVTECRDPILGRVSNYAMIQPFGMASKVPPLSNLSPVIYSGDWRESAVRVEDIEVPEDARNAIRRLWPLKIGNMTNYELAYDAQFGTNSKLKVWVKVEVVGSESLIISNRTFVTYIISSTVTRSYPGTAKDDNFVRTLWYDPSLGIIVKQKHEWLTGYRKGRTSEYKLHKVTFPHDPPVIAQTAPQTHTPQPAQAQQLLPQPEVATLPAPKPPAQKAVEVVLDDRGPAMEVPASIETDQAVVEIVGLIVDDSRIVEVRLDGRPVPMSADGTISLKRGVPEGATTFMLSALDEWGNVSRQSVTVTRTSIVAPKVLAEPNITQKPVSKVGLDNTGPKIALPESLSTTERIVRLGGQVSDASKVIEVTVEGRPVAVGNDGSIIVQRALSIGANTIRVMAFDEWGNKAEKRIFVERLRPFTDINFGAYHAIVIGNNDYANMPKLKTAVSDAEAVAQILRQDYSYSVNLLVNATRSAIIDALAKARATLKANDNLLIYYAGHGILDTFAGEGFWLPVDADKDSPSNWVSNSDVTNMLRAIRAKHVMVVADSCYSGTLVRTVSAEIKTAKEREAWLKKMVRKRTRTALVSGGLEPVIDSGGGEHSIFAKAFLDALRSNEDVLEAERLFSLIKRPVALESDQTPQYSDVRRAGHDGGDFMFVKR